MSPEQIAAVIATAQRPRQARIRSRLFGYKIEKGKAILAVESEAAIIRLVFEALAAPSALTGLEILAQLAENFRKDGKRNRSNQYYSVSKLRRLIRPIFAGLERTPDGWIKVGNYPRIVNEGLYWKALRRF